MKPLYKILIVIGLIAIVALGIFLSWEKLLSPLNPESNKKPPEINPPDNKNEEINSLSDNPVFDFWITPDNGEVYYITPDGKIFAAKDGPDLEISKQTISALNFIELSPNNQFILTAFADPKMPQWGIFDLIDKVWRPLPQEIINATWNNTDETLVGIVKNQNNLNLSLIDLSKNPATYKTLINDFRLKDVRLEVLSGDRLIISEKPSAYYPNRVWQINLKDLTFNTLIAPEKGLVLNWSKDRKIIFKFSSPNKFSIYDAPTLKQIAPPLFNTLPQKCDAKVFSTSSVVIYCFVPKEISPRITLPDDYFQKKFFTNDDLLMLTINIENGDVEKFENIFPENSTKIRFADAKNIEFYNNQLYFLNNYDNQLYKIEIKNS